MAIRFTKPPPDPPPPDPYGHIPRSTGESNLPRLEHNADYVERAAIRNVLLEAKTRRQAQLDLTTVLAGLQSDSMGPRRDSQIALSERLRRIADMPSSIPAPPECDGMPAALADALELLAGKAIEPAPDLEERKKRLRQELAVLGAGLAVAEARLTETREAQTIAVAESLLPFHREQLLRIYEAAAALAEAMQAERQTISDFILAGYSDASAILLRPSLAAAGRLGTLDMHDSEISTFRRRMQELGII
jgi:hypothetical protein